MNNRSPGFPTCGPGMIVALAGLIGSFCSGQEKPKPQVIIPEASEVAKIIFVADKAFPGGPFELSLMKPDEIKPLITLLKDVGWEYSKSGNAKVLKTATYANITITQKNNTSDPTSPK